MKLTLCYQTSLQGGQRQQRLRHQPQNHQLPKLQVKLPQPVSQNALMSIQNVQSGRLMGSVMQTEVT